MLSTLIQIGLLFSAPAAASVMVKTRDSLTPPGKTQPGADPNCKSKLAPP